jgi:DNA-directed RNA polymerase specialized sigma24 family protein
VLRFYEDLEYAEIAAVLGCTEATARSHVHRALGALRERMAGEDG